jgi:hypothetical protein
MKAGPLVVQEVGYNSNLETERAITGLPTLHQEIVLRKNLLLPPNAITVNRRVEVGKARSEG